MAGSFLGCAACLRRIAQIAVPRQTLVPAAAIPACRATSASRRSRPFSAVAKQRKANLTVKDKLCAPRDTLHVQKLNPDGSRVLSPEEEAALLRKVKRELRHRKDAYTIALRVHELLEKDAYDEALLLTREASSHHKATVSWNHLINYLFAKQRMKRAIRVLNDVSMLTIWARSMS